MYKLYGKINILYFVIKILLLLSNKRNYIMGQIDPASADGGLMQQKFNLYPISCSHMCVKIHIYYK